MNSYLYCSDEDSIYITVNIIIAISSVTQLVYSSDEFISLLLCWLYSFYIFSAVTNKSWVLSSEISTAKYLRDSLDSNPRIPRLPNNTSRPPK